MNTFYLPTSAYDINDIKRSLKLLRPFSKIGEKAGLMLFIKDGIEGIRGEKKDVQYNNLDKIIMKNNDLSFIVMASNKKEDLDFYHKPEFSVKHIKEAIDFASEIPGTKKNNIVTFHLNTLFNNEEWKKSGKTPEQKLNFWIKSFKRKVWPNIRKLSKYARNKKIKIKVESTPIPEFGDSKDKSLNSLGNPYPLYSGRGFKEIRDFGAGIVLDLCHTYTLFKAASLFRKKRNDEFFDVYKGLFPYDLRNLNNSSIIKEVNFLDDGDLIHISDSMGLFDPKIKEYHQEGIVLGKGEIKEIPKIIKKIKNKKLGIVFEINEDDFEKRSNTIKSINYFLNQYAKC